MKLTLQQLKDLGYVETAPGMWHKDCELRSPMQMAIKAFMEGKKTFPENMGCVKPPKRIRQSTKPLMNKLEQEFHDHLCSLFPSCKFHAQSIRFKLGNGIWYKPDEVCFDWDAGDRGRVVVWEVKGPFAHRGGFENLKVAAHQYPEILWNLVWKNDYDAWQCQEILP